MYTFLCYCLLPCSLILVAFQVLLNKFLLRTINTLHGETGDVQKQGKVLVSAVTILCIAHQLKILNQLVATDCVLFVEILKLAASREGDGSRCSAYKELIRCSLRYAHIHYQDYILYVCCEVLSNNAIALIFK